MKRFVIAVDTQGDFMNADGALSVAGADALTAPMQHWLAALRPEETEGVLFTFDTHLKETFFTMPESKEFPIHCVRETEGWANVLDASAVDPAIPTWRLEKGVFDMWAEDGVMIEPVRGNAAPVEREAFFEGLKASGITEVAVIGVAADYCVKWAVEGLIARGFKVTLPKGLTKGIHRPIDRVLTEDFADKAVALV